MTYINMLSVGCCERHLKGERTMAINASPSKMNKGNNADIVSGLSYLSIFFLPIIFPIITWIAGRKNKEVVANSKMALLLHVIPVALTVGLMWLMNTAQIYAIGSWVAWVDTPSTTAIFFILAIAAFYIINIYMGVRRMLGLHSPSGEEG